ncbi:MULTISPECIES: DUF3298 domain-containing protein [unclassified Romboutsia]|uniref:DUF3298 domain-containing protein n=1 Tax=unclassified Romboutsia TaxID=2626894 RepID=UPI0008231753|nr:MULTISPECIES: DUF3298 domain-containing protein [unclassified Romboutsia]SCH98436.1 Protein of uncharacterised function (DUF3298) [uncultured Clostridium sp.]
MKVAKNWIKPIVFLAIGILIIITVKSGDIFILKKEVKTSIGEYLKVIKVTEEKMTIKDKYIFIDAKTPKIHYENDEVERYINSYIRKDINEYINHQRQLSNINKSKSKVNIDINYHVVYEDENLINIIIYKNINFNKNEFKLEKDSYVFDLKTGQRIYLDNFLKDNEDYQEVIERYIEKSLKSGDLKKYKNKIKIDKNTNFYIGDDGINIYFNPYKESNTRGEFEFKIPLGIFKSKIRMIKTDEIVANIETQTINKNDKYINSIINIPIVMTENKAVEKKINDILRNEIMNFYNQSIEEAKSYLSNYPEADNKFIANTNFEVKKNSNNMLSIVVTYYKYSGGAHGDYNNIAYNVYMKNGQLLNLNDLFKKDTDYKGIINNEIRNQIENLVKQDKDNLGIYQFTSIKDNQKFYIQDDNIVVFFDLYEIAPYAAGIPEFRINKDIFNHILKDEYVDIFK